MRVVRCFFFFFFVRGNLCGFAETNDRIMSVEWFLLTIFVNSELETRERDTSSSFVKKKLLMYCILNVKECKSQNPSNISF